MRKDEIRFRRNANGAEVLVHGKWIRADSKVEANVSLELKKLYPRLYPPAMPKNNGIDRKTARQHRKERLSSNA